MAACRLDHGCGEDPCVCQPSAKPYPKSAQLAQHERRRFRHKATRAEWARIVKAKTEPCRVCQELSAPGNGGFAYRSKPIEFHHIVSRARGGDDVEDNIVALCMTCHMAVTHGMPNTLAALAASLTDPEYAYVVGKLGEAGPERLFGVGRG